MECNCELAGRGDGEASWSNHKFGYENTPASRYQDNSRSNEKNQEYYYANKENESGRRTLLAITVEIEDGCIEHIHMKEGDSAEAVATKFCRDHNLPDQFVAPLTEHIVSNIISISKEDKAILFCSNEECSAYEESWLQQNHATNGCQVETATARRVSDHVKFDTSAKDCACQFGGADYPGISLIPDQNVKTICPSKLHKSPARPLSKTYKKMSESLLAPTHTSQAKKAVVEKEMKHKARPITERAKCFYMRLYCEFMRHKQKLEQDRQRSLDTYQENIEKTKICIPKKSWKLMKMRGRRAKQFRNYGELLYTEGLLQREKLVRMIDQKQKDDEAKEMVEVTGKPEISKRAKKLWRDKGNIWQRLTDKPMQLQIQLQEQRNAMAEAELVECTFKPQINHLVGLGDDHIGLLRFEQLFLDAESRRRRQVEYSQWFPEGVTFRPTINRNIMTNNIDIDATRPVYDRLLQYATKLNEKKQLQSEIGHSPIDRNTGRELFTPLTGRRPQTDRNSRILPIGEFLYKMRETLENKREALVERARHAQRAQAKGHYVGATSQKILERLRQRGFKRVFDALDDNKDGSVELATANLSRVSEDVANDIHEIIKKGKGEGRISLNEFKSLMHEIEEQMHKGIQVNLVLKHQSHGEDTNLTFHCKMNPFSQNLAKRRREYSSNPEWYQIIIAEMEKKKKRLEGLRQDKHSMEMLECTFRPHLYSRGSKKKGCPIDRNAQWALESASSRAIVEKELKEVHGFYFQDEQPPVLSNGPGSRAVLLDSQSRAGGSPLGMLDSLKLMVSRQPPHSASATQRGRTNRAQGGVSIIANNISPESNLPDPNGDKSKLFYGVMGV